MAAGTTMNWSEQLAPERPHGFYRVVNLPD